MKRFLKGFIIFIFIVSCLAAGGYYAYQFSILYKEKKYNDDFKEKAMRFVDEEYHVDFTSLRELNEEIMAYIIVPGTSIAYPVVKSEDNSFYLEHSLDKTANSQGWIFANKDNTFDGEDINIAVFGNEGFAGSMFGGLKDTLNIKWQNNGEDKKVIFITEEAINVYAVFSTYKMPKETYYIKNTFPNNDEYQEFLNLLKERSNYDYGVEVTNEDQIITLATINKQEQYVLHAKKLEVNN